MPNRTLRCWQPHQPREWHGRHAALRVVTTTPTRPVYSAGGDSGLGTRCVCPNRSHLGGHTTAALGTIRSSRSTMDKQAGAGRKVGATAQLCSSAIRVVEVIAHRPGSALVQLIKGDDPVIESSGDEGTFGRCGTANISVASPRAVDVGVECLWADTKGPCC